MTAAGDGHEPSHDRRGETRPAETGPAETGPAETGPAETGATRTGPASTGPASTGPAETEPDPRFTLANERTFLAWSRTALALVAAGLGIVQLLPPFPGVPLGRHLVGVPLIVLGAVLAIAAYTDMMRNQRALRRGEPLPRSVLPRLLAGTVGAVATLAAIVVLLSATR
jgi:putative membrane protein